MIYTFNHILLILDNTANDYIEFKNKYKGLKNTKTQENYCNEVIGKRLTCLSNEYNNMKEKVFNNDTNKINYIIITDNNKTDQEWKTAYQKLIIQFTDFNFNRLASKQINMAPPVIHYIYTLNNIIKDMCIIYNRILLKEQKQKTEYKQPVWTLQNNIQENIDKNISTIFYDNCPNFLKSNIELNFKTKNIFDKKINFLSNTVIVTITGVGTQENELIVHINPNNSHMQKNTISPNSTQSTTSTASASSINTKLEEKKELIGYHFPYNSNIPDNLNFDTTLMSIISSVRFLTGVIGDSINAGVNAFRLSFKISNNGCKNRMLLLAEKLKFFSDMKWTENIEIYCMSHGSLITNGAILKMKTLGWDISKIRIIAMSSPRQIIKDIVPRGCINFYHMKDPFWNTFSSPFLPFKVPSVISEEKNKQKILLKSNENDVYNEYIDGINKNCIILHPYNNIYLNKVVSAVPWALCFKKITDDDWADITNITEYKKRIDEIQYINYHMDFKMLYPLFEDENFKYLQSIIDSIYNFKKISSKKTKTKLEGTEISFDNTTTI